MLGALFRLFMWMLGLLMLILFWPVGLGLMLIAAIMGKKKEIILIKKA